MQTFTIRRVRIPVSTSCPSVDAEAPSCGRILVVSGDPDLRAVLTRILEDEGYAVDAVSHSGHAQLLCRTTRFGVLLAELCGPDMTGPALTELVQRHCPEVAALYLANPGTPERLDNVLVRPFTREDLLERVRIAVSAASATVR
jgi:two-component system, OmpR family, response regulator TctD